MSLFENIEKSATVLAIGGAVTAGVGALSGLIGASIFNNSYPDWTDISTHEFVDSMIVGELILIACPLMYAAYRVGQSESYHVPAIKTGLFTHAVFGSVSGMLGSEVLGHLNSGSDVGFSAAAGAAGATLSSFISFGLGCVLGCNSNMSESYEIQPVVFNSSEDYQEFLARPDLENQEKKQQTPLLHAFRRPSDELESSHKPLPNRFSHIPIK